LQKPNGRKNARSYNEVAVQTDNFPIVRRFLFLVFGLLGGFRLSLWGWKFFDDKRLPISPALIGIVGRAGIVASVPD
jgi:hypothetical protein